MNIIQLKGFILERLEKIPTPDTFKLYQTSAMDMGVGELLLSRAVNEDADDPDEEADSIANEIHKACSNHLMSFHGSQQRYKVTAETDHEMLESYAFTMGAKMEERDHLGMSEPPTERGLLAQLMRHNEALMRANNEMAHTVVGPLIQENQALRQQRNDTEKLRLDYFLNLESLLSEKQVRDIEIDQHNRDQERKDLLMKKVLELAPAIAEKLSLSPATKSLPNSNGKVSPTADLQATFRSVVKLLDRGAIYSDLREHDAESKLDRLLGYEDSHPQSTDEFKGECIFVWSLLSDETTADIHKTLAEKDPEKLMMLMTLLGINVDEIKREVEEDFEKRERKDA